jgi:hypothetical protein
MQWVYRNIVTGTFYIAGFGAFLSVSKVESWWEGDMTLAPFHPASEGLPNAPAPLLHKEIGLPRYFRN